ncbi:hypothetical protein DL98DRAFT_511254 [Cadophora sp. DSE1049]|nr:hypothetical protein DL98DRAFT_511254 [Cadophora sp. DSE1049]
MRPSIIFLALALATSSFALTADMGFELQVTLSTLLLLHLRGLHPSWKTKPKSNFRPSNDAVQRTAGSIPSRMCHSCLWLR